MSNSEKETKGKFSPKGIASKIGRFFRDMRGEVKKVVWPSKKQIINNTVIVIVFMVIAAVLIGGFDMILSALVNLLFTGA